MNKVPFHACKEAGINSFKFELDDGNETWNNLIKRLDSEC